MKQQEIVDDLNALARKYHQSNVEYGELVAFTCNVVASIIEEDDYNLSVRFRVAVRTWMELENDAASNRLADREHSLDREEPDDPLSFIKEDDGETPHWDTPLGL